MSYGGRTYRCLKKVIKKRQEERKKSRKFTTEEDKNRTKYDKFIKLAFRENRTFIKYNFIELENKKQEQGLRRTAYGTGRRLTCPKKATRK